MARIPRFMILAGLFALMGWITIADDRLDIDSDLPKKKPAKAGADDLLEDALRGTPVRLVAVSDPKVVLATRLFWRTFHGAVAAETVPAEIRLDDELVMVSQLTPEVAAGDGPEGKLKATTGAARIEKAEQKLFPGKISLGAPGGRISSKHPAIKVVQSKSETEVQVLCAPVLFDSMDENGAPAPQPFDLFSEEKSVLRQATTINKLTIWLPVGLSYRSTWGRFDLAADGTVRFDKATLPSGVRSAANGLHKVVPVPVVKSPTMAATEFLTVPALRPFKMFAALRVDPGKPLLLAVDRTEYEKSIGGPFVVEHVGMKPTEGPVIAAQAAEPPAADLANRVTRSLGAEAKQVAWFTLPADSDLGAHSIAIETKAGNVTHRYVVSTQGKGLFLAPHRLRTVFAIDEQPEFSLIMPKGFPGGKATFFANQTACGSVELPAISGEAQFDSRQVSLDLRTLAAGHYTLEVRCGELATQPIPIKVVSLASRSPFFSHYMGWSGGPPETDEGLGLLEEAGLEMVVHGQPLEFAMPSIDDSLAAAFQQGPDRLPPELCLARTRNDERLQRYLKHRIRLVDFAVGRAHGFYNEGLSYHHSHPESVQRVIRNLQIFTQQVADYPSFGGINYSWFPQMYGYVEGGVPTDAWVGDRNRALTENINQAGVSPVSGEEQQWYQLHRRDSAAEARKKALAIQRQAIAHWKKTYELSFGLHNQRYNDSVRQIRPDVVNTLYENAGHDSGKRPESLFADMPSACYFTMTDYGDWPMSGAFTTDWSRAQSSKDVWLTAEFLNSTEGETKQLFQAFARGLAGGGLPMGKQYGLPELRRRGKVMQFINQYGAIAKYAAPDRTVALLATNAKHAFQGNGSYDLHAVYHHLTHLGFPPAIVTEDALTADSGVLTKETRLLVLVNVEDPLSDELVASIGQFQKRGGKVLSLGPEVPEIQCDLATSIKIQSIWTSGTGFGANTHPWMWKQFVESREALTDNLQKAGLAARAAVDSDHGFAIVQDADAVRYVTVIADRFNTHVGQFEREAEMPVSIEGTGWKVRDLRQQIDLPTTTKDGRTIVTVELATEPTTILACYREAPSDVRLSRSSEKNVDTVNCSVLCGDRVASNVPVLIRVLSADGSELESKFAGSQDGIVLDSLRSPSRPEMTVQCQELLTGLTTTLLLIARDAAAGSAVRLEGPVTTSNLNESQVGDDSKQSYAILVEPGRSNLVSIAQKLAAELTKLGIKASVVELQAENFDTQPNRWIPRREDRERDELIHDGKLIGFRQNLAAYIDRQKAVHIPERGGFGTIAPDFDIQQNCILFSGGMFAESLRIVSSQMESPNVPGVGQARVVKVFSPFHAEKDAIVIVAHDSAGYQAGANRLATLLSPPSKQAANNDARTTTDKVSKPSEKSTKTAATRGEVARPYQLLTPYHRVEKLMANSSGQAAVVLRDRGGVALLDDAGKVVAAVKDAGSWARIDDLGRLWDLAVEEHDHAARVTLRSFDRNGTQRLSLPVFDGELSPPGMLAGFAVSPSGTTGTVGRPGRILFGAFDADSKREAKPGPSSPSALEWNFYDDTPYAGQRFAVLYPRMPIAAEFSPDGQYLCVSLDTRPPLNNMSGPLFHPTFCETVLIDTKTGQRVWSLRDETPNRSTYAIHQGFLAVAREGSRIALADFDGNLFVVNAKGEIVASEQVKSPDRTVSGRFGPKDGVAVGISEDGKLAAFAFRSRLVLCHGDEMHEIAVGSIVSMAVARNGKRVVVGIEHGQVLAFDPQGASLWSKNLAIGSVQLASTRQEETLVGTGDGEVILLGADGKELRRIEVFQTAKKVAAAVSQAKDFQSWSSVESYSPPPSLEVAKKRLQSKLVASWNGKGPAQSRFGREFQRVDAPIELSAPDVTECFLHLIYRRPEANQSLTVMTEGGDGKESFVLDLPTPSYRVIDIPVRGPQAKVTITMQGPVEIAECGLWSLKWPAANMAFVTPSESQTSAKPVAENLVDDLLEDLKVKAEDTLSGQMKPCRIWWPNMDPDRVKGPFLPASADPLMAVDGKRFIGGKAAPWTSGNSTQWGASWTIDFGKKPVPVSLVATYERATKQSQVSRQMMVFSGKIKGEHDSPPSLDAAIGNDQFWRLFDFPTTKVQSLGIHVLSGTGTDGLSEFEVYR